MDVATASEKNRRYANILKTFQTLRGKYIQHFLVFMHLLEVTMHRLLRSQEVQKSIQGDGRITKFAQGSQMGLHHFTA